MVSEREASENGDFWGSVKKWALGGLLVFLGTLIGIVGDEIVEKWREVIQDGTIEFTLQNHEDLLRRLAYVEIDRDGNSVKTFHLRQNKELKTSLEPGSYHLLVKYGKDKILMDERFELGARERIRFPIQLFLPASFQVKLSIIPQKTQLNPNEPFTLQVESSGDGFVWLFSPDKEGNAGRFFPPTWQESSEFNNEIQAEVVRMIPTQRDGFVLKASEEPGVTEDIIAVVTQSPDVEIALKYLKQIRPDVASGRPIIGKKEEAWGVAHLSYQVIHN